MDGSHNDLQERGGGNFNISSVLLDILANGFSRVHVVAMTGGHLFHDMNQRLNQTPEVIITVNLRKRAQ